MLATLGSQAKRAAIGSKVSGTNGYFLRKSVSRLVNNKHNHIYQTNIFADILKHLTAFVDLVYRFGLEKMD